MSAKTISLKTKLPGPVSQKLMQERNDAISKSPFHVTPLFVAKAKGSTIQDVDGNVLLDFAAGIGVCNVGHNNDAVVQAIRAQSENYLHTSFNVLPYEGYVRLAQKLNQKTPGTFAKKSFFANSGAEAVENAVKIARSYTGRPAIVCFDQAFHGRTYLAMTLTAKSKPYKFGFDPFCPEIYRTAYPDSYRMDEAACFDRLVQLIESAIGAEKVAAVIFEPVLGEGGFISMPASFAQKLETYCREKKILIIADEIQTGFGRTGTLFACEQLGIAPDLITTAKGLGGGMPISAVTGRAEIMDAPPVGGIGGTFGGSPVSCAAALAVFDLFQDGKLLARAKTIGEKLRSRLELWKREHPSRIGAIHGLGPMLSIEFVQDATSKKPDPTPVKPLIQQCYENGVIVMGAGTYGNIVRLLLPLVTTDDELEEGLSVMGHALADVLKRTP